MTESETDPSSNAELSKPQQIHEKFLGFCKHPASILVWFCLISLIVKEQYPFSNYPMYSGWSERTYYFYIADENGPVQAKSVFKVSVPTIKKRFSSDKGFANSVLKERREATGNDKYKLTDEDYAEAGRRLLKQLRDGVPKGRLDSQLKDNENLDAKGKPTPMFHPDGSPLLVSDIVNRNLVLVRVDIMRKKTEFSSEPKTIVTTDADNKIVTE